MASDVSTNLVLVVSDKNVEFAVKGLLSRPKSLGIVPITYSIFRHPNNDPGCFAHAHEMLRPMARYADHALVLFDRKGCGHETSSGRALEEIVDKRLAENGWDDRAATVVFDPELEAWVWSDSPHVERVLGWSEAQGTTVRAWLEARGLWPHSTLKPAEPKVAVEYVLRRTRKPRSSALYEQLASKVGLARCTDASFLRFRAKLQSWFQ